MNWRKGLFRLWLVLAIVWITGGMYLTDHGYWRTQLLNARTEASIKKARLDPDQDPFVALDEERKRRLTTAVAELKRRQAGSVGINSSTPYIDERSKEFEESYGPYFRAEAYLASLKREYRLLNFLVFVPPILILFLGLAFFWIRAGFKPRMQPQGGQE